MADLPQLKSKAEVDAFTAKGELSLVHFYASWAPQCAQLNTLLIDLGVELRGGFTAAYVDAEEVPEASLAAGVKVAPTVVFYKAGKEVDRLDGFKPVDLRTKIALHAGGGGVPAVGTTKEQGESLNDRLAKLVKQSPLMLFMKGTPETPRCGFSRNTVGLLNDLNLAFGSFDILSDEEVRQGLKEYSNWPTYPQLYLNGELIGGLDVLKEELKDPEFVASLPKAK